ncbi:MAG: tRNA (guanosine(46)-N7)-methyltransferase TrmB [Kiloniellales bacterium]|nr:tRNA (guanosine(46)-N7)-methyltransferase TrmB [Kiloniellales bacterium]
MAGRDPHEGPGFPRRKTHGRRLGRPLRPKARSLLESRLPELAVSLPAPGLTLDAGGLFDVPPKEVWLEIGFGSGEHLVWQAAENRDVGMLGAEVFINGVAAAVKRIEAEGVGNVRLYQGDARDLLDALPPAALGRVFLLFPDPWPKVRHHKRRLLTDSLLDRLATTLSDGGELRIATDHDGYLRRILELTTAHPAFRWLARGPDDWRRRPDDWPSTRYELKALSQGRRPAFLRFLRVPRDRAPATAADPA